MPKNKEVISSGSPFNKVFLLNLQHSMLFYLFSSVGHSHLLSQYYIYMFYFLHMSIKTDLPWAWSSSASDTYPKTRAGKVPAHIPETLSLSINCIHASVPGPLPTHYPDSFLLLHQGTAWSLRSLSCSKTTEFFSFILGRGISIETNIPPSDCLQASL